MVNGVVNREKRDGVRKFDFIADAFLLKGILPQ